MRPLNHALVLVPFSRSSGFAITSLVSLFTNALRPIVKTDGSISVCYADEPDSSEQQSAIGLDGFDWRISSASQAAEIAGRIRAQGVDVVVCLDFPATSHLYTSLRGSGVRAIVNYFGAPMSSINRGAKLALKRLEISLSKALPDQFVFETEAMRASAVSGRGIPLHMTSVVPLGTNLDRFYPNSADATYAHNVFSIPTDRHLVFYSGHFEERKGVRVLVKTAKHLVEQLGRRDIHFLLLGNRSDEAAPYQELLAGSPAAEFVTFGGYRTDVDRLHRSCSLGAIASTGWDSMTVSAVEMAASGLPLVVSRLQGLPETIDEGITGFTFAPGSVHQLSSLIVQLVDDGVQRVAMSRAARARALRQSSFEHQVNSLRVVVEQTIRRAEYRAFTTSYSRYEASNAG
jgi:glycosyltransferase involved in cell wall biosynthesis